MYINNQNQSAYDHQNIFAKILRGDLPCHRVYEDDHTLGFLDVMPQANGHTLVIPKHPCRNLFDCPLSVLQAVMTTTHRLALVIKHVFNADGLLLRQSNECAGGQVIFHLHMHIIPCMNDAPLKPHSGKMETDEILKKHANLIREAML